MRLPTRLVLLGHPVSQSLSPRFQNAALQAAQIPVRYEALDVEPHLFEETVDALRREGAAGNITVPFKERMFEVCRHKSALAERARAVNTWWVDDAGE